MSYETIGNWIQSAKTDALAPAKPSSVKVVKRAQKSKGGIIIELAERFFPWLMKMAEGVRGDDGLPVQSAHVRSVAINLAEYVVNEHEKESHA